MKSKFDYVLATCDKQTYHLIGISRDKDVIKRKIPLNYNKDKVNKYKYIDLQDIYNHNFNFFILVIMYYP